MPTVLRDGPYRIYFYSHEPNEPPHVQIDRDDQASKSWLRIVVLAQYLGFGPRKLRGTERLIAEHQQEFIEDVE